MTLYFIKYISSLINDSLNKLGFTELIVEDLVRAILIILVLFFVG